MSILLDGNTSIIDISTIDVLPTDQLLIHFWLKPGDPGAQAFSYIYDQSNATRSYVRFLSSSNRVSFVIKDTLLSNVFNFQANKIFNFTDEVAVDLLIDQTSGYALIYIDGNLDRSETPIATNQISHIASNSSVGSRRDATEYMPSGSMIDDFYYSNTIPEGYVINGGITSKFIKDFYDISNDGSKLFRKSTPRTVSGVPQIYLGESFDKFNLNYGSETDGVINGTPQFFDDSGMLK